MSEWGIGESAWYGTNTRETVRDDILRHWLGFNAVASKPGLATTSPAPRWLLRPAFAALFNPELTDDELLSAVEEWVAAELGVSGRVRALALRATRQRDHAVEVRLPTGGSRQLEPGGASQIVKGVVEEWAPRRLAQPFVISISEPGTKIAVADGDSMAKVGLSINVSTLLPDALIVDVGVQPIEVWVIEIVHSDGPISDERRVELTEWAARQGIEATQLRFLTAFESRNARPAKRRLKDLASGSYAWFLTEPESELYFGPIESPSQPRLAVVTEIRRS